MSTRDARSYGRLPSLSAPSTQPLAQPVRRGPSVIARKLLDLSARFMTLAPSVLNEIDAACFSRPGWLPWRRKTRFLANGDAVTSLLAGCTRRRGGACVNQFLRINDRAGVGKD